MRESVRQLLALSRRSVLRTLRQPQAVMPAFLFPLLFLALTTAGASAATRVPGFPADSYLDFLLAGMFVQGAMTAAINTGTDLAIDLEDGFFNRLSLTPMWRPALLLGQVAGALSVGLAQGTTFLFVGLIFGVDFRSGPAGMVLLLGFAVLTTLAFAGIGALLALRTASSEAVQGMFPLFFVLIMFSSFFLPRDLITVDWFRTLATYNPISYVIEAMRSLVITGWEADVLALGAGLGAAIVVVGIGISSASLRTRLTRT